MITEGHLNHWLSEMEYALNGISNEISKEKLKEKTGIKLAVSPNPEDDVFVSFEYLQEKASTLKHLIGCIKHDMVIDTTQKNAMVVTTKGWSPDEIKSLSDGIKQQKMRLMAKVKMPDGSIKYMYGRTKADMENYAKLVGASILETTKIDS